MGLKTGVTVDFVNNGRDLIIPFISTVPMKGSIYWNIPQSPSAEQKRRNE